MNARDTVDAAQRWSLRLRVVVAILIAALAPQLIVFAWSQLDRNVPGRMWGETWHAAEDAKASVEVDAAPETLAAIAKRHRVRLRVIAPNGDVRVDVDADDPRDPFGRAEELLLGASTMTLRELDETRGVMLDRTPVRVALAQGQWIACDTIPLLYCEGIRVTAQRDIVHVQRSSRRAVQAVYALRAQLVRLTIFTVPIALIVALYTGRRVVRPVEHLRKQALARVATANPGAALDPERPDEVGALADAFNALLESLAQKRAENEAFVADLVHELKNPVAAVRATADALATQPADRERAARLSRVLGESATKLDRLVSQFLELARADAGMPNEERAPVDVGAMLRALAARFADDPRYADVRFSLDADGDLRVQGVPYRLEALFAELYDNAASFAAEGGRVAVRARHDTHAREVVVDVEDSGPGIAAADLPRVFDRFFTTRGEKRGTGLGLALVRAVARAHGGDVSVSARAREGATFTVRLPAA